MKTKNEDLTLLPRGTEVTTAIEYPDEYTVIVTDGRGVKTTTKYDEWRRPVEVTTSGIDIDTRETWTYDIDGQLTAHTRKQKVGSADAAAPVSVTTRYEYDTLGRTTKVTTDNVAVDGAMKELATTTVYDDVNRTATTTSPSGAVSTTYFDALGRTTKTTTTTNSGDPLTTQYAYDLDDNVVYSTDGYTANAASFDAHGRMKESVDPAGVATRVLAYDGWGNAKEVKTETASGTTVAHSTMRLTPSGRVASVDDEVDGGQTRTSSFAWDGGGRTTRSATMPQSAAGAKVSIQQLAGSGDARTSWIIFDKAGRLKSSRSGGGSLQTLVDTFSASDVKEFVGTSELPQQVTTSDRSSSSQNASFEYDTLGNVKRQSVGGLTWEQSFDESGNVTGATAPNRKVTKFGRDASGQLVDELLQDGSKKKHQYSAAGAESQYRDETEEPTVTLTDLVGRPTSRSYADGTAEIFTYDGPRLKSFTDRQKRTRSFDYDSAGRVSVVWFNNEKILRYDYDEAGRVRMITNVDAQVEYANFDLDGNPRKTIQRRFKEGSGLSGAMVLDEYEQEHEWNVHGERSSWTMPRYTGFAPEGWTDKVTEGHDAAGNVNSIDRTRFGSTTSEKLLDARFLEAGRPEYRTLTTAVGVAIRRDYGYRDADAMVTSMIVSVGGREVAGSKNITYDGVQKSGADIVGVSGGTRASSWSYDERGRLKATAVAREKSSQPATEVVTKSDFRTALERTPETPVSPKAISFSELSGGGHKIASVTSGSDTRAFDWKGGAERVDDGNFVYEYDATGRLIKTTEKPRTGTSNLSLRRVKYFYDGRERLVGRRAEYASVISAGVTPLESDWKVEDRAGVIAADGIPAETTFLWDAISDNLVAVFRAGSSSGAPGGGAIDANGGLVRQIIHGSLQYDDPIEVAVADPAVIPSVARKVGGGAAGGSSSSPNSGAVIPSEARNLNRETLSTNTSITHLYPIYDEAAAGSLQAIINTTGEIVSRNFAEGAYGEDAYALGGAAVDRIAVHAAKDDQGNVTSVDVTVRTTEPLKSSTLAAGLRLAAVTKDGEVVRSSSAVPTLFDNNDATAVWKLTPAEWNALVDPAAVTVGTKTLTPAALSIAATSDLRAEAWGDVLVLGAPDWALQSKPAFSSATLPVEVRESLANLSQWLSSIPAKSDRAQALYEVDDLSALGIARTFGGGRESVGDPAQLLLGAAFHAQPFSEPVTGKNYVRARWYDPGTGTWLTPDPLGNRDSSNMYAFAGGDPVNGRDPSGMASDASFDPGLAQLRERERAARAAKAVASETEATARVEKARATLRAYAAQWRTQHIASGRSFAADDPIYRFGFTGYYIDAIGNLLYDHRFNDILGLEDQSPNLVLTLVGAKIGSTVVAQAYRIGGWRLAIVTAADELAGQIIGVNPSAPASAVRSITNSLEAQRFLAQLTREVNADLAANPTLAAKVLRREEYDAATRSVGVARMQYGNAVERLVAQRIESDPVLRQIYRHVGGANNPDFTAFGRNFDITTETKKQVLDHMKRPRYGNNLIVLTYERPISFTTFPGAQ